MIGAGMAMGAITVQRVWPVLKTLMMAIALATVLLAHY
jgi:hypothetical protein